MTEIVNESPITVFLIVVSNKGGNNIQNDIRELPPSETLSLNKNELLFGFQINDNLYTISSKYLRLDRMCIPETGTLGNRYIIIANSQRERNNKNAKLFNIYMKVEIA